MKSVLSTLRMRLLPQKHLTNSVARICGLALKSVGLNVAGKVYQVSGTKGQTGWLVNLTVPSSIFFASTDLAVLQKFLTERVEAELDLPRNHTQVTVGLTIDPNRQPFAGGPVNRSWLRNRLLSAQAAKPPGPGAQLGAVPAAPCVGATPLSPPPRLTATHVPEPRSTLIYLPIPAAASAPIAAPATPVSTPQVNRPVVKTSQQIRQEFEAKAQQWDQSGFDVFDGSLSDFQRVYD